MARSHHEVGEIAIADGLLRDLARTDKGPAAQLGPGVYFKDEGIGAKPSIYSRGSGTSVRKPHRELVSRI